MSTILYFDCFSGISGDMVLGSLLDLDMDRDLLFDQLNSLNIEGYRLSVSQKVVNGIAGTDFDVIIDQSDKKHRHLPEIETIIASGTMKKEAKEMAMSIFRTIAEAEAKVHNTTIEKIHFHEVGAIDSIIDIVGAAICITTLNPDKIVSSSLHLGSGTVKCAHGILPVPAPATAEILKGIPVYSGDIQGELVTPTGAAIIKTVANEFATLPSMAIEKTGYGTGKKQFEIPNLLRTIWGTEETKKTTSDEELMLLETNIDDMNPEYYSNLIPLLLEKGALDAYLANIIMKKGRPGNLLSVLCYPNHTSELEEIIFTETSTLGIRKSKIQRSCLERKEIVIDTELGPVKVKAALKEGEFLKAAPEYEDCRAIAQAKNLPLKTVYETIITSNAFKNLRAEI